MSLSLALLARIRADPVTGAELPARHYGDSRGTRRKRYSCLRTRRSGFLNLSMKRGSTLGPG
jgi:hypothetical protein